MHIPVPVMFHSVGLNELAWASAHISDPLDYFVDSMRLLQQQGWGSEFFVDAQKETARRSVVLTFDDGYLDNWVLVLPILLKYGMKSTIFVNPGFVHPDGVMREQWVPGTDINSLQKTGFLSWEEIRAMEKTGLVDIQSHTMTHTSYRMGPEIVDYWHPGCCLQRGAPLWMLWNQFPEERPHHLQNATELEKRIPYGTPIHKSGKALTTREFFPQPELASRFQRLVAGNGGNAFFEQSDWKATLEANRMRWLREEPELFAGDCESEHDYDQRVMFELTESKRILEDQLNKRIKAVCWPGGGVDARVLGMARQAGYELATRPTLLRDYAQGPAGPHLISRMGGGATVEWQNKKIGMFSPQEFVWRLRSFEGSWWYHQRLRVRTVIRLARQLFMFF